MFILSPLIAMGRAIKTLNELGGPWCAALAQSHAGDCLLEGLVAASRAIARPGPQLKAVGRFQELCGICSVGLQNKVEPALLELPVDVLPLSKWRDVTAALPAWLRRHTPQPVAQRCCSALSKVDVTVCPHASRR